MTLVIEHPKLSALQALWEAKRGAREFPSRADFDVLELTAWMGNLTILEVVDGGADFRFRLHGTNIVNLYGHEMTGKLASTLPLPVAKVIFEEFGTLVHRRAPMLIQRGHVSPHRDFTKVIKLLLPLYVDDETSVQQLFSCSYPVR